MKIKWTDPVEISQTASINVADQQQYRFVGYEELIYEKVIELEEQMKLINKKLDKILGDK